MRKYLLTSPPGALIRLAATNHSDSLNLGLAFFIKNQFFGEAKLRSWIETRKGTQKARVSLESEEQSEGKKMCARQSSGWWLLQQNPFSRPAAVITAAAALYVQCRG